MTTLNDEQRRVVAEKVLPILKGGGYEKEATLGRVVKGLEESLPWFVQQQGLPSLPSTGATASKAGERLTASARSLYRGLQSEADFAEGQEKDGESDAIEAIQQYLFKDGMQGVSGSNLQAQVTQTESLLLRCKEAACVDIFKKCGLEDRLPVIQKALKALEAALDKKDEPKGQPSGREMQAARLTFDKAHSLLRRQMSDRFDETKPEEKNTRDQIAAILESAQKAVLATRNT